MARIKHAVSTHRRKKRVLKRAKGFWGHRSRRYQQARRTLMRADVYAYRDRRVKKREFRQLWILRINAACREEGITYSRFIKGLTVAKVEINRKVLAELAVNSPLAFKRLVKVAQEAIASAPAPTKKTPAKKKA